jgi:lysophospholipase L1-like esterase
MERTPAFRFLDDGLSMEIDRMRALSTFLCLGILAAIAGPAAAQSGLKAGDRVVFLGDSITAGGNGPKGYIGVIRQHLADKKPGAKIECINAGISGNKVPDLQRRVEKDVIARMPTVVVIYIGINDVWHGESDPKRGTDPEAFEAGLKEVIGKIEKSGARVVLCTPTVIGERTAGGNKSDAKLDQYADISRKIAKDGKLPLCDLRKAFVDHLAKNNEKNAERGILTGDRVHLNEAGNRLVAETMLKSLGE